MVILLITFVGYKVYIVLRLTTITGYKIVFVILIYEIKVQQNSHRATKSDYKCRLEQGG